MKHVLLLDHLDKLVIKKDSSLLFAQTLKDEGYDVSLLFEEDFFFSNTPEVKLNTYSFQATLEDHQSYLKSFEVTDQKEVLLNDNVTIHIRLDPPFDSRYLRYLWMLLALEKQFKVKLINHPKGILYFNEKLASYTRDDAISSFVGSGVKGFKQFYHQVKDCAYALIFKPLDLFQGIGVEKLELSLGEEKLCDLFRQKVKELKGPVVVQPYLEDIEKGEIRTLFFKGHHIGSIIKTPKEGDFLSNIARGATFKKVDISKKLLLKTQEVSKEFSEYGVEWIAFDIIGEVIQEINITCPGLLCEVSKAHDKNLAKEIVKLLGS